MKRMYVVLSVIILFFLWMLQALGQKLSGTQPQASSQEDQLRRHLELREEMHKRIRDKLINGVGSDEDLFQGMDVLDSRAASIKSDWTETSTGRVLTITPEDSSQKIDLDVKYEIITIKGEAKVQTQNGSSMSNFSSSLSVPHDCDGSRVKITNKDGKILLEFPYRKRAPVRKDSRIPLPPMGEEVTI